jgi:hypothetical protein
MADGYVRSVYIQLEPLIVNATITNTQGNELSVEVELSSITVESEVISGILLSAEIELSAFTTTGTLAQSSGNALSVSIALPSLKVSGLLETILREILSTFCMNTRNSGLTSYDNYNFNSFCKFNGKYFGATSGSISLLDNDRDDITNIDFELAVDLSDVGVDKLKRINDIFMNMKSDGDYELKISIDEEDEYIYQFKDDEWKLHMSKVKVGKGMKGSNIKISLINKSGSDVELDSLEATIETLSRRT